MVRDRPNYFDSLERKWAHKRAKERLDPRPITAQLSDSTNALPSEHAMIGCSSGCYRKTPTCTE